MAQTDQMEKRVKVGTLHDGAPAFAVVGPVLSALGDYHAVSIWKRDGDDIRLVNMADYVGPHGPIVDEFFNRIDGEELDEVESSVPSDVAREVWPE